MGGRRAADLTQLVGKSKPVQAAKRRLSNAVSTKDPKAIADASAGLLTSSPMGMKNLRLGLKLSPYIEKNRAQLVEQTSKERHESIRNGWAETKKRENIRTSPEVDNTVISAATAAFRKRR